MGVSPKALSLMPAEPLGEGGNSVVLPSLGQVATSKSDTLEAEIFISLHPAFPAVPSSSLCPGDSPMTSALLSALDRNLLPCMRRKRYAPTCGMVACAKTQHRITIVDQEKKIQLAHS